MASDAYLDSSLVLKLYRPEHDSARAQSAVSAVRGSAIVSALTDVEVIAVLQRNLSSTLAKVAVSSYKTDRMLGLYRFVDLDPSVYSVAAQIAENHAKAFSLRSLDILHLATALRHSIPTIATFDKDMRAAAGALGLAVLPA